MYTLTVRRIAADRFGSIGHFEKALDADFDVVRDAHAFDILRVLDILLDNKAPPSPPPLRAGRETRISAEVRIGEKTYFASAQPDGKGKFILSVRGMDGRDEKNEYCESLSVCREEENSCCFRGIGDPSFLRLFRYMGSDRSYPGELLSSLTDGFSRTRTFRSYLRSYIGHFQPERLGTEKELCIELMKNGSFLLADRDGCAVENLPVGTRERMLMGYQCFLHISSFWSGFQNIRNCNHVNRPLTVLDAHSCGSDIYVQSLLAKRITGESRQIIVFAMPGDSFPADKKRR